MQRYKLNCIIRKRGSQIKETTPLRNFSLSCRPIAWEIKSKITNGLKYKISNAKIQ